METRKNSMLASFDPSLQKYQKELESHDWYWSWRDDNRVWSDGERNQNHLIRIAEAGGIAYKILYNEMLSKNLEGDKYHRQKPFEV
jgi:hypothetical protein